MAMGRIAIVVAAVLISAGLALVGAAGAFRSDLPSAARFVLVIFSAPSIHYCAVADDQRLLRMRRPKSLNAADGQCSAQTWAGQTNTSQAFVSLHQDRGVESTVRLRGGGILDSGVLRFSSSSFVHPRARVTQHRAHG